MHLLQCLGVGQKNRVGKEVEQQDFSNKSYVNPTIFDNPYLIRPDKVRFLSRKVVLTSLNNNDFLGRGSFGIVSLNLWEKPDGQIIQVAVKKFHRLYDDCNLDEEHEKQQNRMQTSEISVMYRLDHPNIVKLYGITIQPSFTDLVLEYCPDGSLYDRLRDKKKPAVLVTRLLNYAQQLCAGMTYLEDKHFVHRDLATRNILLTDNEKTIKITDFGLTRFLENGTYYKMQSKQGIPYPWCPPEVFGAHGAEKIFTHESDIWSFGVTLWEMFSYGQVPWAEHFSNNDFNLMMVYSKIVYENERLKKPDKATQALYDLMYLCWKFDAKARPTFSTLEQKLANIKFTFVKILEKQQTTYEIMETNKNDVVVIIENSDMHRWYGQNLRTHKFGYVQKNNISNFSLVASDIEKLMNSNNEQAANNKNETKKKPEVVKSSVIENVENFFVEIFALGKTNLIVQIDGRLIIMYPPRTSVFENELFKNKYGKEKIDCCIIENYKTTVVDKLLENNVDMKWITYDRELIAKLEKHSIPKKQISESSIHGPTLKLREKEFKFFATPDGYIIKSSNVKFIYLTIQCMSKTTIAKIKEMKKFDLALFCIEINMLDDLKITEAFKIICAQKYILLFAENYANQQKTQTSTNNLTKQYEKFLNVKTPEKDESNFNTVKPLYNLNINDFRELDHIGSAKSIVKKFEHISTKNIVAIKFINQHYKRSIYSPPVVHQMVMEEVVALTSIGKHPNIIDFYGMAKEKERLLIFMEYMDLNLSDLYQIVHKKDGQFSEKLLSAITVALLDGLSFCKLNNFIHRDIKIDLTYRKCPFFESTLYDTRSDVWSLGITLLECILGSFPIKDNSDNELINNLSICMAFITKLDRNNLLRQIDLSYSVHVHEFLRDCLETYDNRPKYDGLMETNFYKINHTEMSKLNIVAEILEVYKLDDK